MRSKYTCVSLEYIPYIQNGRMLISKWEVALGAPDRENIPCLMYGTHLCQKDLLTY